MSQTFLGFPFFGTEILHNDSPAFLLSLYYKDKIFNHFSRDNKYLERQILKGNNPALSRLQASFYAWGNAIIFLFMVYSPYFPIIVLLLNKKDKLIAVSIHAHL